MVNDVSTIGGGQQVMLDVADGVRRADLRPVFLCPEGWLADQAVERGIEWHPLRFEDRRMLTPRARLPRPSAILRRRSDAAQLSALLRRLDAAVLHTGALVPHVVSMFLPRGRTRIVWHVNQISPRALFAGPLPDAIIGVSDAALSPATWRSAASKRAMVVPNSVDLERFRPLPPRDRQQIRRSLGIDADTPVAVVVARLERPKGVDRVIRAVARSQVRPVLLVVGTGIVDDEGYAAELERSADASGCDVRFLGERNDVSLLIGASDVFLFASRWEAYGLVLAEAAACGIPVISDPAGGCKEVVSEGVSGHLVDADDSRAFAAALDRLLLDETRRTEIGARARQLAEERFDRAAYVREIEACYRQLATGPRR